MHMRAGRKKLPYGQPARCAEARFAGFDREGRCIMKRLTAALLAIALILTACAAPAGSSGGGPAPSESTDGGSGAPSESTDSGSGAAYEGRTDGQSRTESGEGFVTAQESREERAAGQEEDSAANSTDADDGPQNGLVIIEEREGNYRSAADRKKTKEEDTAHSALMAAGENGEDGPKVDHSTAGAIELKTLKSLSFPCVAGHHSGLPDIHQLLNDRLNRKLPSYESYKR